MLVCVPGGGSAAHGQVSIRLADEPAASQPDPGDEFDALLNLAEQDVGQLTQVRVAERVPSLDTVVSTVSRAPSTVGKSPAAVFVITNDMIRRSGARSLPEVLRMAPGVNVARVDSNHWAVSIRGFNDLFTNKLLVQVDGRTVYTPLFGGVFWAAQDVLLEDVERIEVIRGPGASVWGANAVNGIINIITKPAGETQGLYTQVGGGTYERGFANLRYGGQIGSDIDYRIYGMWFERGTGIPPSGPPFDDWRMGKGGFRLDWDPGRCGCDVFTLQGDVFETTTGIQETIAAFSFPFSATGFTDVQYRGADLLGRWTHIVDDEREWQLQAYCDYFQQDWPSYPFIDRRFIFDVDFQYRFPLGDYHKLIWGAGYRIFPDHQSFPADGAWTATVPRQTIHLGSYFLQDEIALVPDRWTATLGCKFLHNTYTDFEYQPTARLLFTPDDRQTAWASVSRAVRLPTRFEETSRLTVSGGVPAPVFPQLQGRAGLVSEELLAWEVGYRTQPTDEFSWDLALFFNQYENLIGITPGLPQFTPQGLIIPLVFENTDRAQSYGFELAANQQLTDCWQLRAAYSFLRLEILGASENDATERLSPINQLYLQSSHELGCNVELDLIGRYVDALPANDVPSYIVGDVRLSWHYGPNLELFVVGRNLLDNGHQEFISSSGGTTPTGVRSEVYAGASIWR